MGIKTPAWWCMPDMIGEFASSGNDLDFSSRLGGLKAGSTVTVEADGEDAMLDELAGLHVELDPPDVAGRSQLDDRRDVADDAFFRLRGLCDAPLEAALADAAGEEISLGLGSSCGFPPKAAADAAASFGGYAGGVDGADRGLFVAERARARTLDMGADSERERKLPRGFVVSGDLHVAAAAPVDLLTREGCGERGESGPSRSGEQPRELNPKQPMVKSGRSNDTNGLKAVLSALGMFRGKDCLGK
ncbi:unnamed protein product [Closterium sp. Naga37s-1]|nr:unnamed protein product [Closterium sp. Naga37s-1]